MRSCCIYSFITSNYPAITSLHTDSSILFVVRGGLTLREGVHIMEIAHRTGWLGAVDMVEINPRLGDHIQVRTTLEAASHVIKAAFGFSRSGHVPPHIEKLPGYYAPILISEKPKEVRSDVSEYNYNTRGAFFIHNLCKYSSSGVDLFIKF